MVIADFNASVYTLGVNRRTIGNDQEKPLAGKCLLVACNRADKMREEDFKKEDLGKSDSLAFIHVADRVGIDNS
jgi:hypothetical protein